MIFIPLCYCISMQAALDILRPSNTQIQDALNKSLGASKGGAVVPATKTPSAATPTSMLGSLLGGESRSKLDLALDIDITSQTIDQTGFGKLNTGITNLDGATTQVIFGDYEGNASSSMTGGTSKGFSTKK